MNEKAAADKIRRESHIFLPKLMEEMVLVDQLLKDAPTDAARRIAIRAGCAVLEGYSCFIRDLARQTYLQNVRREMVEREWLTLEPTLVYFLDDYSYQLSETGEIQRKGKNDISFTAHFAFGVKTFYRAVGLTDNPIQGDDWDAFKRIIKVRNRITHPKTEEDILVTEQDVESLRNALTWATNLIIRGVNKISADLTPMDPKSSSPE